MGITKKRSSTHTQIGIGKQTSKKTQKNSEKPKTILLKSLAHLTDDEIIQLSQITNDLTIMKFIGKGNIWSLEDLLKYRKEELHNEKLNHRNRTHYSYVLINNSRVIGFIEGRKNKSLLPKINKSTNKLSSSYDILMRMFISQKYKGMGYGKLIIQLFIDQYKTLLEKYFKKHKINNTARICLYSDIDPNNIASIKIHLHNNFLPHGTFKYPNNKIYNRYKYNVMI